MDGLCGCGCGEGAPLAQAASRARGIIVGQQLRFVHGHRGRLPQRRGAARASIAERLWRHILPEPNSGCWIWTGGRNNFGYGQIGIEGRAQLAHRVSYMTLRGPVPTGLVLDHLCGTRCCVNPAHLDPVPQRVNAARGAAAHYGESCPSGHEPGDMRFRPDGSRYCSVCNRQREKATAR